MQSGAGYTSMKPQRIKSVVISSEPLAPPSKWDKAKSRAKGWAQKAIHSKTAKVFAQVCTWVGIGALIVAPAVAGIYVGVAVYGAFVASGASAVVAVILGAWLGLVVSGLVGSIVGPLLMGIGEAING